MSTTNNSAAAASDSATSLTEEQIVQQYNRLRQDQSAIMSRIAELENESHEHDLVAEELRPLNGDRCCHHLVGGALVKRTVGEVLPEIEANLQAIRTTIANLNKSLVEKERQMDAFVVQHKISRPGQTQNVATASAAEGNRGVLA